MGENAGIESSKKVLVIKLSPVNGVNSSMMRTLALIKGLQENCYSVDLITIKESATHVVANISKYEFLKDTNIVYANGNSTYDKIVSANGGLKKRITSILRNVHHAFAIYDFTSTIARNIKLDILSNTEYEYVISVSDPKPAHIAMRNLIKQGLKFRKWIEYWGDPMAIDITKKSVYPQFIYRFFEKKLFDTCDSIVYTSPFTCAAQEMLYPKFKKIMKFVPTAYMEEKVFPEHEGKYMIGYYGAYTSSVRNIMPLYLACSSMKDIELTIVGNSDLSLEEKNNVSVYPRGNVDEFEKKTDLFICLLNSSGTQIPGKVYHYAATNRPVLIILDGEKKDEMKSFFNQFNRYAMCNNDPEDIISAINEIKSSKKTYAPLTELSCKVIASRILGQ